MIKKFKIKHKEIYPDGQWVKVCNEKDKDLVNDEDIYYYVDDDIDLSKFMIGDMIELDEQFKIMGCGLE